MGARGPETLRRNWHSERVPGDLGPQVASQRPSQRPPQRPQNFRQEKEHKDQLFGSGDRPGGVGVFHAKGWWPETSCSPSKVCLPWVSKRGIWDVPGILPGCPGILGVFKKFVLKKFVRIFRSLKLSEPLRLAAPTCCPVIFLHPDLLLFLAPPWKKARSLTTTTSQRHAQIVSKWGGGGEDQHHQETQEVFEEAILCVLDDHARHWCEVRGIHVSVVPETLPSGKESPTDKRKQGKTKENKEKH